MVSELDGSLLGMVDLMVAFCRPVYRKDFQRTHYP